jgi:hypothetical protein
MIYYDSEFFGLGIFFRWQGSVLTSPKCAPTLRQQLGGGVVQCSQRLRVYNSQSRVQGKRSRHGLDADPAPVVWQGVAVRGVRRRHKYVYPHLMAAPPLR